MWQPQGFFNQYTLRSPVILSGEESARGLYNYPSANIVVIHGASFQDYSILESTFAKKQLHFVQRSWTGEPDVSGLKETIHQIEQQKPDTIIAIGGGSVIDGVKLCRLFYEIPYFDIKTTRLDGQMLQTNFIAIPTTIGSGAEVSSAAVFVDHIHHRKDMVVLHELQPDVIVYDRRYVQNTPLQLLCASALDAFAHIMEGYVSKNKHAIMEIMAEKGCHLLHQELGKLLHHTSESFDFERLFYAGYLGGMVQNHCIVGAAHAIAHQLTDYGYSHGEAVALLLPAVIRANIRQKEIASRYEKIAVLAGFENVEHMLSFLNAILDYSGISKRKKSLQILLMQLSKDSTFCDNVKNDRGGKGNPVDITEGYIGKLISLMDTCEKR